MCGAAHALSILELQIACSNQKDRGTFYADRALFAVLECCFSMNSAYTFRVCTYLNTGLLIEFIQESPSLQRAGLLTVLDSMRHLTRL